MPQSSQQARCGRFTFYLQGAATLPLTTTTGLPILAQTATEIAFTTRKLITGFGQGKTSAVHSADWGKATDSERIIPSRKLERIANYCSNG